MSHKRSRYAKRCRHHLTKHVCFSIFTQYYVIFIRMWQRLNFVVSYFFTMSQEETNKFFTNQQIGCREVGCFRITQVY
jgi:hypothetical protein